MGDGVFYVLAALARKASNKKLIIEPLLLFLMQFPQLSEPFVWFILQVLDSEEALKVFVQAGKYFQIYDYKNILNFHSGLSNLSILQFLMKTKGFRMIIFYNAYSMQAYENDFT